MLDPHVTRGFTIGSMNYTVSEVSRMSGVSVRTLHHYDELGLATPAERSKSGYRIYSDDDLAHLQTVLFYRELGFGLSEIARLVTLPGFSRKEALREQHALLTQKRERIERMLKAVESALVANEQGVTMTKEDLMSPFGDFDPTEYEDEVKERWGDSDAFKASQKQTSRYSDDDWKEIQIEADGIAEAFAELKRSDVEPEAEAAMDVAERHRRHIDGRFYPCSAEMHDRLGEMYVADTRFTAYWDEREDGLARFVRDAISANAIRQV